MANGVKQGEVVSQFFFFSLYIDPLLNRLRMSGFGCHIKGVYMGALSYADDIAIMCPSIGGLKDYRLNSPKNSTFCLKTLFHE